MPPATVLAFAGEQLIARGDLQSVALTLFDRTAADGAPVLLFDGDSGRQFDIDLSGSREAVAERHGDTPVAAANAPASDGAEPGKRGRGRPRLGVVGREVTLLPRHWSWLEGQRGGASATLRRLVDEARRADESGERRRRGQDRAQRFMAAVAGDLPGFEEAARALYAGDGARFEAETAAWPVDVRSVARELAADAFGGTAGAA